MPTSPEAWLDLTVKVGGVLAALWTFAVLAIRRPLIERLNGFGGRLKLSEASVSAHDGRLEALERTDATHNFQVGALSERQGRLEGRQERMEQMLEETLRRVESRLGNIEGQLSIIVGHRDKPIT